jgi:hypothetical protein
MIPITHKFPERRVSHCLASRHGSGTDFPSKTLDTHRIIKDRSRQNPPSQDCASRTKLRDLTAVHKRFAFYILELTCLLGILYRRGTPTNVSFQRLCVQIKTGEGRGGTRPPPHLVSERHRAVGISSGFERMQRNGLGETVKERNTIADHGRHNGEANRWRMGWTQSAIACRWAPP